MRQQVGVVGVDAAGARPLEFPAAISALRQLDAERAGPMSARPPRGTDWPARHAFGACLDLGQ
ncbi:MAG TPA: hypothetical protein VN840_14925 [Streptosporangiaceae bacterium]|nr:hypothetical protein [Streptosporangiaceae bacterium]